MNKILIVGHPQSGYRDVEALLQACGMAQAQPSRRDGFLPQQISETLCKAHSAAPLQELGDGREITQIQAGPVWHGMALDLLLGNLEQPLWGWADPQALYLLDYWRELDPSIHFILVYDRPQSVITRAAEQDAAHLTPESVDRLTRAWAAYNSALLHFFHRNPGRCLLVHSRQVGASASRYLQQVRARIDAPWGEALERLTGPGVGNDQVELAPERPTAANLPSLMTEDPALALFIADALTQQQPGSLALYEELQASANLPLATEPSLLQSSAALQAWHAMMALQHQVREEQQRLTTQAKQFDAERATTREALAHAERNAAQVAERARGTAESAQRYQAELAALKAKVDDSKATQAKATQAVAEENELLLSQLHHVQEELERYYLENCALKSEQTTCKAVPVAEAKQRGTVLYGAADRVRQQLTYRVGATLVQRSRSVGGWVGMPWAVMRVVRQFRADQASREKTKLPPITAYRDAHEAERLRDHLSWRVGRAFLDNARTPVGWLRMPFALRREVRDFRAGQGRQGQ